MGTAFHWGRTPLWEQPSCSISESWRDPCGSGLASRKGCTAAPGFQRAHQPWVMELGAALGIKVEPALEALKVAVHI